MKIIALDYDKTFTANPDMWVEIAGIVKKHFKILGVTARNRYETITDNRYFDICDEVIYCAGNAKQKVLQNFHYPEEVIWIDDDPVYIVQAYSEVHGHPYALNEYVADDYYTPLLASNAKVVK